MEVREDFREESHNYKKKTIKSKESHYKNRFFSYAIYSDKSHEEYTRTYINLPDVISNVGGLISMFMPYIEYLFSFYSGFCCCLFSCFQFYLTHLYDTGPST